MTETLFFNAHISDNSKILDFQLIVTTINLWQSKLENEYLKYSS